MKPIKRDNTINLISKTRKIANQFLVDEMAKADLVGLAPSHGEILILLIKKKELTMTEIAEAIGRERSTVTTLIGKLKTYGYVDTKKSPTCGRTTLVYLTEKGEQLENTFDDISAILYDQYKLNVSEEDLATCRRVLQTICNNLTSKKE